MYVKAVLHIRWHMRRDVLVSINGQEVIDVIDYMDLWHLKV